MAVNDIHHFSQSSSLKSAEYDREGRTLTVTFTTGRQFTYDNIGPEKWSGLKSAGSAGSFLHRVIAGRSR